MELRYSFVIYIGIPIMMLLLILRLKKPHTYKEGKRVANTKYVKSIPYYNNLVKKYRLLSYLITGVYIIGIFLSLFLLAGPSKIDTNDSSMYNRDIFLCMDVSTSVNEVNLELVKRLKDIVNNLKGERFGISIFNTSSVLLVPLTDDYDYILGVLDTLSKSFEANNVNLPRPEEDAHYLSNYIKDGTSVGWEIRGSSIIGDGLASAIYSFTNFEEDRTRVIIFSTDNELEGTEIITLQGAAEVAKSKNIIVYGIAPKTIGGFCLNFKHSTSEHKNAEPEFEKAVKTTGGDLYVEADGKTVASIVDNIEQQQKSLMKGQKETRRIDRPQVPFIMLIIFLLILFILKRKI